MLQHGISMMVIESDQVWMSDVSSVLNRAFSQDVDFIAGNERANENNVEEWYICGGFYGIISSDITRTFFKRYLRLHHDRLMKYKSTTGQINVENDQALLSRLVRKDNLRVHWLNRCEYTNGMWYVSDDFRSSCSALKIVHNNYIVGNGNKVTRAKKWGHWFVQNETCSGGIGRDTLYLNMTSAFIDK